MKAPDREELLASLIRNANCRPMSCALQRLRTYLPDMPQNLWAVGKKFGISSMKSTGIMDGWDSIALPTRRRFEPLLLTADIRKEYDDGFAFGRRMASELVLIKS